VKTVCELPFFDDLDDDLVEAVVADEVENAIVASDVEAAANASII